MSPPSKPSNRMKHARFSDHFGLGKSQAELDFVDIPLDTEIPLFVDPYTFSIDDDPWFVECNNLVIDYFQRLVHSIQSGNDSLALHLLSNLHEPNDTRLGYSLSNPSGRGIGRIQAADRGTFGILVCRKIVDQTKTLQRAKDALHDDRGNVLVLDDSDLESLLNMRAKQDFDGIANHMDDLFRRLVM